jgi:hypothetical protein
LIYVDVWLEPAQVKHLALYTLNIRLLQNTSKSVLAI